MTMNNKKQAKLRKSIYGVATGLAFYNTNPEEQ